MKRSKVKVAVKVQVAVPSRSVDQKVSNARAAGFSPPLVLRSKIRDCAQGVEKFVFEQKSVSSH